MWINAEAQINGVAVWLNQQHHSVTTPQPLDLTPQLRAAVAPILRDTPWLLKGTLWKQEALILYRKKIMDFL